MSARFEEKFWEVGGIRNEEQHAYLINLVEECQPRGKSVMSQNSNLSSEVAITGWSIL
jgi:hypothetical protein